MTRSTYTVVMMEIPLVAYDFIAARLHEAGYSHAFMTTEDSYNGFPPLDMTHIAVVPKPAIPDDEFIIDMFNADNLRGYDYACKEADYAVNRVLDGKGMSKSGVSTQPWHNTRNRLIDLVKRAEVVPPDARVYDAPADEMAMILRRALNTLEPVHTPHWALQLADDLQPGDTIKIVRKSAPIEAPNADTPQAATPPANV